MAARRRRCAFCETPLPKDARPNRKFCDDACRRGKKKPDPTAPLGPVAAATEKSIDAATHLTDMDAGAVQTVRNLARTIDAIQDGLDQPQDDGEKKPRPLDNVTVPTYLKFCESLGLTPAGRQRLELQKEGTRGNLAAVRDLRSRQAPSKKRSRSS